MIRQDEIKAIFFDADDTLYSVRDSVGARYHPYFLHFGIQATINEINAVVPKAWHALSQSYENHEQQHVSCHERDQMIWREYISYVLRHFSSEPLSEELFQMIYHEFEHPNSRELSPGITELLTHLKDQQFITGIFTNNDRRIHSLVTGLGLKEKFDHVFCASDIGYKKPSPHVFQTIAKHCEIEIHELLYIGDCIDNDVRAGQAVGCQVLWYSRKDSISTGDTSNEVQVPTISCFQKAKDLFHIRRS